MTYQAISNPYMADVLKPHDAIWVREFGTQAANVGDAFTSTVINEDVPASISARLGMLDLNSIDYQGEASDLTEPRGRTFLLPEWSTFKSPPLTEQVDPDFKAVVLIAHVLLREETNQQESDPAFASLVISGDTLVGDAQDVPMVECTIGQTDFNMPPMSRDPSPSAVLSWDDGGTGGDTDRGSLLSTGRSVYFRVQMFGSEFKQTEMIMSVSLDGISWTTLSEGSVALGDGTLPESIVRRVGLSSRGMCVASLDWMRLYNYPVTSFNFNATATNPTPPVTGGRLFIP